MRSSSVWASAAVADRPRTTARGDRHVSVATVLLPRVHRLPADREREGGVPIAGEAIETEALPGDGPRVVAEATGERAVGHEPPHAVDQAVGIGGNVAGDAVLDDGRQLGGGQGD